MATSNSGDLNITTSIEMTNFGLAYTNLVVISIAVKVKPFLAPYGLFILTLSNTLTTGYLFTE